MSTNAHKGTCRICKRDRITIVGRGMCGADYGMFKTMFNLREDKVKDLIAWREANPVDLVNAHKGVLVSNCVACGKPFEKDEIQRKGLCGADYQVLNTKFGSDISRLEELIAWRKTHPLVIRVGAYQQKATDFRNSGKPMEFSLGTQKLSFPEYVVRRAVAQYIETCPVDEFGALANSAIAVMIAQTNFTSGTPTTPLALPSHAPAMYAPNYPERPKRKYTRSARHGKPITKEETELILEEYSQTGEEVIDLKKNKKLAKELGRTLTELTQMWTIINNMTAPGGSPLADTATIIKDGVNQASAHKAG